ncbi:MAG: hypothetical protein A3H51_00070 [Candidatus Spechtbacteria bacterium RIFCSPLOWO2_02_FULL_38_8]|uniref:Uncharacterized protein n=1 Tax=Candidatus Spechtbacteria bacterium RIFCSPLOWO2_02_FULL_38_8 TaxID=1802164 RepID=A0A1G2HJ97_9BACT|nr:MAG: hypothetical protein A3H51_00070 [Candidatus Spechtbacteria bacterium RIFCSPLOWO2_02_FULL_38_8]
MKENFSELISYLDMRFAKIETRLDDLSGRFDDLQVSVDGYAKRAEAYFQEMVMLSHRVSLHEKWLRQIAEKVGVKLEDYQS